jgi:putative photosynthetic complex assembly protein 2
MLGHGLTFLFTIGLWWLSTGIVLKLCSLPKRTFGWSLIGGCCVFGAAVYGVVESARTMSAANAYLSFLSALGMWGWVEMSFLMGYVTGPRTTSCPPDAKGWQRFTMALETLLYHELAIVGVAGAIVLLTWGAPNQTGTFAFLILMVMRISAKLNIFLGVPNLTDEFLPERLSYLKSYFRTRSFNALFPVSILLSTLAAIMLAQRALGADGPEAIGFALLFTLITLAILEHFFMIVPLPDAALWRWAMPAHGTKQIEKPLPLP